MPTLPAVCRAGAIVLLLSAACGSGSSDAKLAGNPPNGGTSGSGSGGTAGIATGGSAGRTPDATPDAGGNGGMDAGADPGRVDASDGGNPPLDAACAALAQKTCEHIDECSHRLLTEYYATLSDCVTIETTLCEQVMTLSGVQGGVAEVVRLAGQVAGRSCQVPYLYYTEKPGTLPGGAACRLSQQCASRFCQQDGIDCGTCAEVGDAASTTCRTYNNASFCDGHRVCDVARQTCVAWPTRGEPCINGGCSDGLVCQGGRCEPIKLVGESCDPGSSWCVELPCDPTTRKCPAADHGKPAGSVCNDSSPGYCATGLHCEHLGGPGTCQPNSELGAPCAASCPLRTLCINGRCELPLLAPAACR